MPKRKRISERDVAYGPTRIKDWLNEIVVTLQSLSVKEENREKIKEWCEMRQKTLAALKELITSIRTTELEMSSKLRNRELGGAIVSLTSNIVQFITTLSGILDYGKPKTRSVVRTVGKVSGTLGTIVSKTANMQKSNLIQSQVKKAASILENDRKKSNELLEFFKPSQKLKNIVEDIMDFDLFCNIVEGFKSCTEATLPGDMDGVFDHLQCTESDKEKAKKIFEVIYTCRLCKDHLLEIVKFPKEYASVQNSFVEEPCDLYWKFGFSTLQALDPWLAPLLTKSIKKLFHTSDENSHSGVGSADLDTSFKVDAASALLSGAAEGVVPVLFDCWNIFYLMSGQENLDESNSKLVQQIHDLIKIMETELKDLKSYEEKPLEIPSSKRKCD